MGFIVVIGGNLLRKYGYEYKAKYHQEANDKVNVPSAIIKEFSDGGIVHAPAPPFMVMRILGSSIPTTTSLSVLNTTVSTAIISIQP